MPIPTRFPVRARALKDAAIELYDFINGVEAEEAPAA